MHTRIPTAPLRSIRALALAAPLALAALLTGCTIQADKVEESIKDELKKKDISVDKIKCPEGEKLKEGATFECKGTSDKGDDFVVKVKQTDAQGGIRWDLEGRVVDVKEFTDDIKKKSGVSDVDCGKNNFIAVKGTKMKCKGGGEEVTFVFTNDEGDFKSDTK